MKMTSNGKILNYKVIDLVESYNFHIKFTSIRVQIKKFENILDPLLPWPTAVASRAGHKEPGTETEEPGTGTDKIGSMFGSCFLGTEYPRLVRFGSRLTGRTELPQIQPKTSSN
jgi:hypothetical protein